MFVLTFVGDFLWMAYWIPYWNTSEMAKWQHGLHMFVCICVFVNWIIKVPITLLILATKQEELGITTVQQ